LEPENDSDVHGMDESLIDAAENAATPDISAAPDERSADEISEDTGSPDEAMAESTDFEKTEAAMPHLRIEIDLVEGNLTILGGSPHVLLSADGDDELDKEGAVEGGSDGVLRFTRLPDDSELRVPDGAEVLVRRIYGDLQAQHMDGFVLAQRISGDATIDRVAVTEIAQLEGDLSARHGGSLRIRVIQGDAEIEDYDEAPVIGHVNGDLEARDLPGLEIRGAVSGDVELTHAGTVTLLGTIGGDLTAQRSTVILRGSSVGGDVRISSVLGMTVAAIGGDLDVTGAVEAIEVHSVGGDAEIRDARGPVHLSTVGGNLEIRNATGGLMVGHAGGDATIDTALGESTDYTVHAGGDIDLRVREDVNARFVARTSGGEIKTRLPLSVERGRRRNLVGVLGHGSSSVTLVSEGGDISIAASDRYEKEQDMSDDYEKQETGKSTSTDTLDSRTWEGSIGGQRFRMRWDRAPGRANFHFQGPVPENVEKDDLEAHTAHDIHFEWEKGQGARMYGEYEERLNDLRGKAEKAARKAADQAQEYAEKATRRARETDWESVGRDVRSAVEKALSELEASFSQLRREWDSRRGNGNGTPGGTGSKPSGAQRVRIEYEDGEQASSSAAAGASTSRDDLDAQRRRVLEQLRSGELSLEQAERQLNDLR
jgi:Putative adhesin